MPIHSKTAKRIVKEINDQHGCPIHHGIDLLLSLSTSLDADRDKRDYLLGLITANLTNALCASVEDKQTVAIGLISDILIDFEKHANLQILEASSFFPNASKETH